MTHCTFHGLLQCFALLALIIPVSSLTINRTRAPSESEPLQQYIAQLKTARQPTVGLVSVAKEQRASQLPVTLDRSIELSLFKATKAAEQAWALSKGVETQSKAIIKAGNSVAAQIALAKSAADTATKEDEKATSLFYKTRTSAIQAAVFAARAYYDQVKAAGSAADSKRKIELTKAADMAETNAAKAAAAAAMPYHAQLLRGQKVVVDYMRKAQAYASAALNLKKEALTLSQSADMYQQNAQLPEASQIMMQAHTIMAQGEAYEADAARLSATANELNGALPALQVAQQAAAESAAMSANPLTKDYLSAYHPY